MRFAGVNVHMAVYAALSEYALILVNLTMKLNMLVQWKFAHRRAWGDLKAGLGFNAHVRCAY